MMRGRTAVLGSALRLSGGLLGRGRESWRSSFLSPASCEPANMNLAAVGVVLCLVRRVVPTCACSFSCMLRCTPAHLVLLPHRRSNRFVPIACDAFGGRCSIRTPIITEQLDDLSGCRRLTCLSGHVVARAVGPGQPVLLLGLCSRPRCALAV